MSTIVTGLRRIAADLGISRKKLARLIEQGLPITRQGERIHADVEECRAWTQIFGTDAPESSSKLAPVYQIDDPRHRERTAAASIGKVEMLIQRGEFLPVEAVGNAVDDRMATLRTTTQFLSRYMGAEIGNATGAEVADALKEPIANIVKPFSVFPWPEPRPAPEREAESDDDVSERETIPRLAPPDPRYDVAVVKMQKAEAAYAELLAAHMPYGDARDTFAKAEAIVRKHIESIPAKVAKKIGTKPVDRDTINNVVDQIGHDTLWAMHADFESLEKAA